MSISEVIRRALEEELREAMRRTQGILWRIPTEDLIEAIRKSREEGGSFYYDISALLNTVRIHEEKAISCITGSYILSLTPYEIGNALWKESAFAEKNIV